MNLPVYIVYHFEVSPLIPGTEILIAELADSGFESFEETPKGISAYIKEKDLDISIFESIQILKNKLYSIQYNFEELRQVNWNKEWESNLNPVLVENRCLIRAPFHSSRDVDFDIIIEPKMSFGTGHHETTYMMIRFLLKTDLNNKTVLDMGCGTAILAILAEKKGSKYVEAIDIDHWCFQNSLENISHNSCQNINVIKGDVKLLDSKKFDVIIANINRNILIEDIPQYSICLNRNGFLFLSGFYKEDIPKIKEVCLTANLSLEEEIFKNKWVALKFKK